MNTRSLVALGVGLLLTSAVGCSTPGGGDTGNPVSRSESLLQKGIQQLSNGEYVNARASCTEVLGLTEPD
jgi:hypothetical protein